MEVSPARVREKEEWRSATTTLMVVCVMTSLMRMLQQLSAMELVSKLYLCMLTNNYSYIPGQCLPGSPLRGIDSSFGSSSGPITLDNVVCTGSEDNLLECSHNEILQGNCEHSEDVAVICNGKFCIYCHISQVYTWSHKFVLCKCTVTCIEDSIRLQNPNALTPSFLPAYDLIKDQVSRGIVELCVAGTFGSICDNGWGDMDASVVCRQLGFSPYGAIALPGYILDGSASPFVRDGEYSCEGSEDKLANCSYQPAATCPTISSGGAGVVCQGMQCIYLQIFGRLLVLFKSVWACFKILAIHFAKFPSYVFS